MLHSGIQDYISASDTRNTLVVEHKGSTLVILKLTVGHNSDTVPSAPLPHDLIP